MSKYVYPAVFKKIEEGYYVEFPDLENCFTQGNDLYDAFDMAEDALNIILIDLEDKKEPIPAPSQLSAIRLEADCSLSLVKADTLQYRKENSNKAVKKALTIPSWLNEAAEKDSVNFSKVLQDALIELVGVR